MGGSSSSSDSGSSSDTGGYDAYGGGSVDDSSSYGGYSDYSGGFDSSPSYSDTGYGYSGGSDSSSYDDYSSGGVFSTAPDPSIGWSGSSDSSYDDYSTGGVFSTTPTAPAEPGVVDQLGNWISDKVDSLVNNPVQTLTTLASLALGIPPIYASALGGAANAAAKGGSILDGALTSGFAGITGPINALSGAVQDVRSIFDQNYNYIFDKNTGEVAPVVSRNTYTIDAINELNAQGKDVSLYDPETGNQTIYTADGGLTTMTPTGESWVQDLEGNVSITYSDGSRYSQDASGTGSWDMSNQGKPLNLRPEAYQDDYFATGGFLNPDGSYNPGSSFTTGTDAGTGTAPAFTGSESSGITTGPTGQPVYNLGGNTYGVGTINRGVGLNPGMIAPTEFYQTTSPVQSKFSWGAHPFQAGTEFNAAEWNSGAGAATPWGLQQMAGPTQLNNFNSQFVNPEMYQYASIPVQQAAPMMPAPVAGMPEGMVPQPVAQGIRSQPYQYQPQTSVPGQVVVAPIAYTTPGQS